MAIKKKISSPQSIKMPVQPSVRIQTAEGWKRKQLKLKKQGKSTSKG